MPPLKQPVPLIDMCMDFLVNRLSNYCHEASTEGSLEKLREGITIIKEEICPHIPWHLSGKFHNGFLQEFFRPGNRHAERPRSHKRAVLEIIMDREIIGLICANPYMLDVLDEDDLHRIQGSTELRWNFLLAVVCPSIENLHLSGLKEFIFENKCTDTHLRVIGRNCPRLEHLNVFGSNEITDEGLRALNECPELRVVCLSSCFKVSRIGIQELLSGHKKIRRLACPDSGTKNLHYFSPSEPSVYPSIETFDIGPDSISNQDFLTVVKKFPNLTTVDIFGDVSGDLRKLSSLRKLSKLYFGDASDLNCDNLKQFLSIIGANITELRMCGVGRAHLTRNDLNFLLHHCGNIERLEFKYAPGLDGEILAIPPFPKLKRLTLSISSANRCCIRKLEFGKMLKLETLTIHGFDMTAESVETMVIDNTMFPNLELIRSNMTSGLDDINRINEIARNKNLNFEIRGWY